MKLISVAIAFTLFSITMYIHQASFTEKEILHQLDLAAKGIPSEYYPAGKKDDIKYNFPLDLEHVYFYTAGSRIHLYADTKRWAIVFETNGYVNRGGNAEINLTYIGNCIHYPVNTYPEFENRSYITNVSSIPLITGEEYQRIQNKKGTEREQFELIDPDAKYVMIRNKKIAIEHNEKKYARLGIKTVDHDNPKHLISFEGLVRYINETTPDVLGASKQDVIAHLPKDLPEIMTIDKFHFESVYNKENLPEKQETYQLIAKVLVTQNRDFWKPRAKPNNHWSNWDSGAL